MRPCDAARLASARAAYPRLFAGDSVLSAPALNVMRPAAPAELARADSGAHWRHHLVPPGATAARMVQFATAQALRRINAQKSARREELAQWLARVDPVAEAELVGILRQRLEWAPEAQTLEAVLEHSSVQTFPINPLADGTPMQAILVNLVYKTALRGSGAYVPWAADPVRDRVFALGPPTLQRNLYGVLAPQGVAKAKRRGGAHAPCSQGAQYARHYRVSYRVPSSCNNDVSAAHLKIQETAAMSADVGYLTAKITTGLIARFGELPGLRIARRNCDNRVYVTYLRPTLNIALVVARCRERSCEMTPMQFGGTFVSHPRFGHMKMLVFPTGVVICVGAKKTGMMRQAMNFFLPLIDAARDAIPYHPTIPAPLPRPADAIVSVVRARARKRPLTRARPADATRGPKRARGAGRQGLPPAKRARLSAAVF